MKVKILCVIGTRPEAIKMAPIILALKDQSWTSVRVLATAQHREMLDETLAIFGIKPDLDLDVMRPDQQLPELTARLLLLLDKSLASEAPDIVLAQGDTTTVFTVALACFYRRISFCHVEAGLRTHDLTNPFPEEMNRVMASHLARLHFAPTQRARANLLNEGVKDQNIHVTGNTVIDALLSIAKQDTQHNISLPTEKKIILLTAHRRENFGEPLVNVFEAIRTLVNEYKDLHVVYPVHPNPHVSELAYKQLANIPAITLCNPLNYAELVSVLKQSWLVLTDSGGLQEEAPALGIPVLVLRQETERPEAIEAGVARLVGCNTRSIIEAVRLLRSADAYNEMVRNVSPYGDGLAAGRIVLALKGMTIE